METEKNYINLQKENGTNLEGDYNSDTSNCTDR